MLGWPQYDAARMQATSPSLEVWSREVVDDVKKYDIVSLGTLERAMLIINDTPGVKVTRADMMPGQQVGTSDFAIGTEATAARNGYVLADNYGSVYAGKLRLSGNVDRNSPTGRGDRLSASGLVINGTDLYNGRVAYSTLVASNGTRVEGAASRTRYSLTDRYAALGATGTADSLKATATTPLKRTRAASIEGGVTLAARNLRDEVTSTSTVTPKRSYSITASLTSRNEHTLAAWTGSRRPAPRSPWDTWSSATPPPRHWTRREHAPRAAGPD